MPLLNPGDLSVELVGEKRASVRALAEPAVDPKGERMRSLNNVPDYYMS